MNTGELNEKAGVLEANGYLPWNDHPGYTIEYLNRQLKPFGLCVVTEEDSSGKLWFKVEHAR